MFEVVIPTAVANQDLLRECLERIEQHTDFPFSITVIVDGGLREDFGDIEAVLAELKNEWRLLHNRQPIYFNRSMAEAIEDTRKPLVVVMGPHVRINDKEWFGKMRMVFDRDPHAAIVDTWPSAASSTVPPTKRARAKVPDPGCRLFMMRTGFAKHVPVIGVTDPVVYLHAQAHAMGNTSWHQAGVRYHEVEHKVHRTWSAPSGRQPSE